ncbi:hypothetical protein [Salibacterium aidingense]|uniref:hypothetical protein n=1 Tax=Salibacterium aidingense TaxID=384933 RepID=UPI003BD6F7D3
MLDRSLKDIGDDIKLIITNKLNTSQSKLLFMGISYEIIQRRDLFPKNSDLKKFVEEVYIPYSKDKIPFRDYLYASRTLLGARIEKLILWEIGYNDILNMVNKLNEIFPSDNSKTTTTKNIDLEITEWMNFIRGARNESTE